ncbi:MAG: response regulator [Lentisphaerae bacterium]|jgi:CheY-like chemotaxis protein|nr:response regulator [Lentisphaerota bacterium]MBT4819376.1 response regulator [Lentisphaerota bacterium]MBT5607150.1 response regulator [Lentisphaerota bacterium]MBT7059480.1 response regulator [Lentisphaerota bacterium]MBT7840317.1 response regulator [Lentisphaerota bacterium]
MEEQTEFSNNDPESQENKAAYHNLLDSIERSMDPNSNTVLIVDDERGIRKLVARNIKKSDKRIVVFEAANGQMALELLEEIRAKFSRDPLFIVTDLNMPVMDGWEFIEHLREDYEARGLTQGIPVVVLSSTSGEKGHVFFRKSVHGGKSGYSPLISVAKEVCLQPGKYDATGEKGLGVWIKHFLRYA